MNMTNWEDRAVYTYKKGVRDHTGISRTGMLSFDKKAIHKEYLIVEIDVIGFARERRSKY